MKPLLSSSAPTGFAPPVPEANETSAISRAVQILSSGGLVAFPTETVYGLGAAISHDNALARVFSVKGRPADHPLIVHLATPAMLERYASNIPEAAWRLADCFWPGPLTLILKRKKGVSDLVTGGQDTIGLRVPSHPMARSLLSAFGEGVAAPSANRFGRVSPTHAAHVAEELGDRIDYVLDGGACAVGLESTIVDLSGERPYLLRPGAITPAELANVLGGFPLPASAKGPRAPGTHARHYAPQTPLRIVDSNQLERAVEQHEDTTGSIAVMAMRPGSPARPNLSWKTMPLTHSEYARALFACLREIDEQGSDCLLVEQPPLTPEWEAINDRLRRAARRGENQ